MQLYMAEKILSVPVCQALTRHQACDKLGAMSTEMFQEAVKAIQAGTPAQRRRAKDLLQRLVRTEPDNASYWVWLSAAVDTPTEQAMCLQKALKLDPNAIPARRGLVLLGALTPEEANLPAAETDSGTAVVAAAGELLRKPQARETAMTVGLVGAAIVLVVVLIAGIAALIFRPQVAAAPTATPTLTATLTPSPAPTTTPTPTPTTDFNALVVSTPLYLALGISAPSPTPVVAVTARPDLAIDENYRNTLNAFNAGRWNDVLTFGRGALSRESLAGDPTLHYLLGEAHRNLGNLREAIASYDTALRLNASFGPALVGRAAAQLAQGGRNVDTARRDLNNAIARDPAFVPAYLLAADERLAQANRSYDVRNFAQVSQNYSDTLAILEQARQNAPSSLPVLERLAVLYLETGRPAEALTTAEAALAEYGAAALAVYAQARAQLALGLAPTEAALTLRTVYPYLPQYLQTDLRVYSTTGWLADIHYGFAVAQTEVGAQEAALQRALALRPNYPQAYDLLGQLALARNDTTAAFEHYQRVLTLITQPENHPLRVRALVGIARSFRATDVNRAANNYLAAYAQDTRNLEAALGAGEMLLAANRASEAVRALNSAVELAAADPASLAQAYALRASMFRALGQTASEQADWQQVLTLNGAAAPTARVRLTALAGAPASTPTSVGTPTPASTPTSVGTLTSSRVTPTSVGTPTPTRRP